jgi:hypothetical protein
MGCIFLSYLREDPKAIYTEIKGKTRSTQSGASPKLSFSG